MGMPLYLWPGIKKIRAMSVSSDEEFVCAAGSDGGGVVIYDSKWKEVARLDLPSVAVPVWMK